MTDTQQKKNDQAANTAKTVMAGIAGVIAGGAAVAAAVALNDKDNQKKITDAVAGAKKKVTDKIDTVTP